MNPSDYKICHDAINNLLSKKYENHNYLFNVPVDLEYFPTYTSVIKNPMDFGTASKRLNSGKYKTKDDFFADLNLCLDNAEKFHKGKPKTEWIIGHAKEFRNFVNRERKRAEKKHGSAGGDSSVKKPKLKLSLKSSAKKPSKAAQESAKKSASKTQPKVKLSLKVKKNQNNEASSTKTVQKPVSNTSNKSGPVSASTAKTPQTSKPKKPKLKLKLSSKKSSTAAAATNTKTSAAATTVAATPTATTPKSASTSTSKKTSASKPKNTSTPKSTPSGPSRGKELPTAVAEAKAAKKAESRKAAAAKKAEAKAVANKAAATAASNSTSSKASATSATSATSSKGKDKELTKGKPKSKKIRLTLGGAGKIDVGNGEMNAKIKRQCYKVISGVKRIEQKEIMWFLNPVNDPVVIDDYKAKIKHPMDFGTLTTNLDKNKYSSITEFVLDLRRIYGNCLRFNSDSAQNSFRPVAVSMASTSEDLMHLFVQSHTTKQLYPRLLYCWKKCLQILDHALTLKNPEDQYPTAHYFLHPVSFYFGGQVPPDYLQTVTTPIDFGTITSKLLGGNYQNVQDFVSDCRLVTANCKAFYAGKTDGAMFIVIAQRLEQFLSGHLDKLLRYDASQQGITAKKEDSNPAILDHSRPPKSFMTALLQNLRNTTYKDRVTKLPIQAAKPFELPVDTTHFPDYLNYVQIPMDLSTVEKNIQNGIYVYAEDFEADVNLIFKNCEAYNIPKHNLHIVNLSKQCAKAFRKQYSSQIRTFDAGESSVPTVVEKQSKKRPSSAVSGAAAPPTKKRKSPVNVNSVGKSATPVPKTKAPPKKVMPKLIIRTDGPLPLHVAIAKIKQNYQIRRPYKELMSWESACSRFYRELKRHPWISTSKRFVFDAPVYLLHPEIKDAYAAKIRNPMDLTTAECKLLQGGEYTNSQEFVDDIARVFANAVTFNKSGHEQGDPTSCAYFDASRHLLRYSRWLSLEIMSQSELLENDSHSEGAKQSGPIPQWKLSTSNKKDAFEEMEEIVMKQQIDTSYEGDRYTWMENECEKLLKSLRHQSDKKHMFFYVNSKYPVDYDAYISKRVDWEDCNRRFRNREYSTFGEIVSDLRRIFTNAQKYNGRTKDKDNDSRVAFDSAVIMAKKLEIAVQRMLVTVSDRVEREKVEQVVLDREQEIAQKEEEEMVRKEMQQERERGITPSVGSDKSSSSSIKLVKKTIKRKELDFDFPVYDEEGSHEQTALEVFTKRKAIYEEQKQEKFRMDQATRYLGYRVHHKLQERSSAIHWAKQLTEKVQMNLSHKQNISGQQSGQRDPPSDRKLTTASCVASLLKASERSQIKISIPNKKKRKKTRTRMFLE